MPFVGLHYLNPLDSIAQIYNLAEPKWVWVSCRVSRNLSDCFFFFFLQVRCSATWQQCHSGLIRSVSAMAAYVLGGVAGDFLKKKGHSEEGLPHNQILSKP